MEVKGPRRRRAFHFERESNALLRQQIALARYIAIKLEIRTDDDWLVRSYFNSESNVGVCCRISRRVRHDPLNIARVRCVKRHRRGAILTGVSRCRTRSRDRMTCEIVSICIENIDGDVRNARAAIEDIHIVARTAAGAWAVGRSTNPNVRWATA